MNMIRIHNKTDFTDQQIIERIAVHGVQESGCHLLTPGITFQFHKTKTGLTIYAGRNLDTVATIREMRREYDTNH